MHAITMYLGATQTELLTVRQRDLVAAGTLPDTLDLTGYTLAFRVAAAAGGSVLITKTTGSGITHRNQVTNQGQADLLLQPADIAALLGDYVYQVWVVSGVVEKPGGPPTSFRVLARV